MRNRRRRIENRHISSCFRRRETSNDAGVVTAEKADAVDEKATEDDAVISHGFPLRKLQMALDGDAKPGGIIAASTAAAATTAAAAASPIAASTHGMSRDVE